jgi:predicted amidohydrolase
MRETTVRVAVVQAGSVPFDSEACVDKAVRLIGEAAAARGAFVVMGVIERELGTCYCTVLFFGPDGRVVGKHRKLMPTALERMIRGFGDGSTLTAIDSPYGRIGSLDLGDIGRGKFDFDVAGHYSRPDVFQLSVNEAPARAVTTKTSSSES